MDQIIKQIAKLLEQILTAIFDFLQLVWTWSFGQIIKILQSNPQSLEIWQIVVLVIAVIAIVAVLYKAVRQLWSAAEGIFKAFITLLSVIVAVLPYIVIAGAIAFAGAYVIQNVSF